ncbi:MAG: DUF952 domain-containing protein [Rhizobiaceae bacterium]|nr:DUF952 domain-containing protein [Rhizobiaceae bacterium]
MAVIYKILAREAWLAAEAEGSFTGVGIDVADGFIHLSTAVQVRETARLWFKEGDEWLLVGFEEAGLAGLKYEPSRGGDLFPHVFAPIPVSAAVSVDTLRRGADGLLMFPACIP